MIKGITVILLEENEIGRDAYNAPIIETVEEPVENVLVYPSETNAIVSDRQLKGRHIVYDLCIPKGDRHEWEDKIVRIRGKDYKTFGIAKEYIPENIPLAWNKQIKCERYE